ncbi:restriction endonuclease subunit S [Stutzerimonas stutzeri]|uniref:restriction endonuclease subunit S n=1 Tax=Stutzerimonas stutzeri TaxID=316 RepID=UPI00210EE459|nr:restriction endonuclease subunit S [Stutzerimonas stutzeri]MCQ4259747.1 restriction endonuclease subunit S [Stutzerimonas stutzeri]
MTFPSYPEYKEAGVEWLGEVPEHWCSAPIKYMALERNSLFLDGDWIESKDISSDGIRYITTGNVGEGAYKEQGAGFISEETFHSLGCTDVYEGDVLISRLNSPIGRACITPDLGGRVVTSVDNVIFRPDAKYHKKFIVYLFSSEEYFKHTGNLARGATMQRISRGLLGNIRVVTPSLEEQTQIARFLDHETARIDALIEEQQRLIELLKEKRQAVISHAVTKGLDPTVPMKNSGVEWLGDVPAHWEALTLGRVADGVKTGGTPSENLPSSDVIDGVEWFTPGDFASDLKLVSSDKFVSKLSVKSGDAKVFPAGAVLIVSIGATLGKVGYILKSASANQQINAVIPSSKIDGYFLAYSLSVKVDAMRFLSNSSTIGIMNQEKTKEIWLSLPPLQEQLLITEFLDKQASVIDTLIREASGGVSLLQERRSALISAAVTGKIDVRGWQLPASAPTPELVEEAV